MAIWPLLPKYALSNKLDSALTVRSLADALVARSSRKTILDGKIVGRYAFTGKVICDRIPFERTLYHLQNSQSAL